MTHCKYRGTTAVSQFRGLGGELEGVAGELAEDGEAEEAEGDAGVLPDFGAEVAASEESSDAFEAGTGAFDPAMGGVLSVGGEEGEAIVEEVGAVDGAESVGVVFGVGATAMFAVVAVGDVVGEAAFAEVFGKLGVPGGVLVGGLAVGCGECEEDLGGGGGEDVGNGGD